MNIDSTIQKEKVDILKLNDLYLQYFESLKMFDLKIKGFESVEEKINFVYDHCVKAISNIDEYNKQDVVPKINNKHIVNYKKALEIFAINNLIYS